MVIVLTVVIVIPAISGNRRNPAAQPSDVTKTTDSAAIQTSSPDTGKPAVPDKNTHPKPLASHSSKPAKNDPAQEPKTEPQAAKPSGPCDLTEAEIPRTLDRAEKNMYAGKLDEALAAYQRVLGCPSAHEKALEGMQRVKQRIAAQSP